ncbi:glycosyl transferase family 2 [Caldithrix abyssi DSM 13497]|uniref:Glycosyl transferase family 2 n=1 Tax=Caldithrix abyssi DSM 13497 TaxID=880073 RepID=H1XYU9_CALAY|nr:glycosyltransferase [Caldithrix abyssi]APF20512.1 Glycosyltransferase involved in cell wall bisynthesis [Caldithrix abyssi DSM 13497]EHO40968.1 glycosyl transferase family 2 [Caldithrix abyssi DSM 13497]
MKISVIIPVYNRPQMVKRAIESVLAQTEAAHEILVINDGSTDETPRILEKFGTRITVVNQPHKGVSAARNTGIRLARGEWIALLDSDDEWLPEKLAMAREFHESHPQYLIFQSQEIWIRHGKRVNPKKKHQKYGGWIFRQSLPLCIVSPSAVVIHQSVFKKVGLFDENFPVCEDYDLWLRVARLFPIGLDSRPGIVKYGGHEDQLSRKYWGMDYYRVLAIEKHLKENNLPPDLRQAALEEVLKKLQVLISGYQKRGRRNFQLEEKWRRYREQLISLKENL